MCGRSRAAAGARSRDWYFRGREKGQLRTGGVFHGSDRAVDSRRRAGNSRRARRPGGGHRRMRRKPSQGVAGARDVPRNDVRLDGVRRARRRLLDRVAPTAPRGATSRDSQACATRTRPGLRRRRRPRRVHQPARRGRSRARVAPPRCAHFGDLFAPADQPGADHGQDARPLLRRLEHRRARRRGRQTRPHRRVRPDRRRIRATHREEVREPLTHPEARGVRRTRSANPPRRSVDGSKVRRGPSRTSHAARLEGVGARSSVRSRVAVQLDFERDRCEMMRDGVHGCPSRAAARR